MSTNVLNYNDDGGNRQAQAVLALFQMLMADGIESSWNASFHRYEARVTVARWENCREQGYVLTMCSKDYSQQLNIAFFEHRNTDSICAVRWEQVTINSPTIDTMQGDDYNSKWDTSHDTPYGEVVEMAKWLMNEFQTFWDNTAKPVGHCTERVNYNNLEPDEGLTEEEKAMVISKL